MKLTLDIKEASEARQAGMDKAINHADQVNPGWSELAGDYFREWLNGWPAGYRFLIEDFRLSASIRGLPEPPSNRSFGAIPVRAQRDGLIKSVGLKATKSKKGHRCFATEWEKTAVEIYKNMVRG